MKNQIRHSGNQSYGAPYTDQEVDEYDLMEGKTNVAWQFHVEKTIDPLFLFVFPNQREDWLLRNPGRTKEFKIMAQVDMQNDFT